MSFWKKHLPFGVGLLISFLSILSTSTPPQYEQGKDWSYFGNLIAYQLFQNKALIGGVAIGILVLFEILVWIRHRPQERFMKEICEYVRLKVSLAPVNEVQISIFKPQSGIRTFLTYLRNLFIAITTPRYWSNGMLKIYALDKFPHPGKEYYVRKEQSCASKSFRKPTVYFQQAYHGDLTHGYMSYHLSESQSNYISIDSLSVFDPNKKKSKYTDDEYSKIETYLKEMRLSFEDLRCLKRASNFLFVEPLVDNSSNYIGALVVDIDHDSKIKAESKDKKFGEFQTFMNNIVKIINIGEINIH